MVIQKNKPPKVFRRRCTENAKSNNCTEQKSWFENVNGKTKVMSNEVRKKKSYNYSNKILEEVK